jgi:hypothetical protein
MADIERPALHRIPEIQKDEPEPKPGEVALQEKKLKPARSPAPPFLTMPRS